jgi:hypothetical protein
MWPFMEYQYDHEGSIINQKEIRQKYKHLYELDRNQYNYVYGLVEDGTILYIGVSKTPFKRYKNHIRYTFNNNWNIEPILLGKGLDRKEMLLVEGNLIKLYDPLYNKNKNKKNKEENKKINPSKRNANTTKGHQGFVKAYPGLGETKPVRVPKSFEYFIKEMLSLCEQVEKIDPEHNKKLQKIIIKYLKNIICNT